MKTPLLICDYDGCLVNSRRRLAMLTLEALRPFAVSVSENEVLSSIGTPTEERIARYGIGPEAKELAVTSFEDLHRTDDYSDVPATPGADPWIRSHRHARMWILSRSPRRPVESSLVRLGWESYFERVLTACECGEDSKASVLRRLTSAETAREIWCIGDEEQDMEAARAIGARAILVRRSHNRSIESLTDLVVDDFTDARLVCA